MTYFRSRKISYLFYQIFINLTSVCGYSIMKLGLKVILTHSEFQPTYQSTISEHFYPKLRVLMVELNVFCKKIFVTIYLIFQTRIIIRIQYSQFGIKMFTSGTHIPRLKLGAVTIKPGYRAILIRSGRFQIITKPKNSNKFIHISITQPPKKVFL